MSNPFTTQQIQDQFASLPADMQQVISGSETSERIQAIGRTHGLRMDGIGVLIEYSGLIMLGLIKSSEFVSQLSEQLEISREQAETIAQDVDNQVFSRVRESLREVQYSSTSDKRFKEEDALQSSVAPTPLAEVPEEAPDLQHENLQVGGVALASQDYNPAEFAQTDAESEIMDFQPVGSTGESSLEKASDALQDSFSPLPGHESGIPLQINTSPEQREVNPSSAAEREAADSIAHDVLSEMPQAVQDAYQARRAAAPAPDASASVIKDFQTRLEEKMAQSGSASINNDPYKESI